MKKLFFSFALCVASFAAFSQTVKSDGNGNFTETDAKPKTEAELTKDCKQTGTLKTKDGQTLPVYLSKNGKPFTVKASKKTGNLYRSYLKVEGE